MIRGLTKPFPYLYILKQDPNGDESRATSPTTSTTSIPSSDPAKPTTQLAESPSTSSTIVTDVGGPFTKSTKTETTGVAEDEKTVAPKPEAQNPDGLGVDMVTVSCKYLYSCI